jgi:nucleotidyltransferase substrate binding protein (TIGR01987 family)
MNLDLSPFENALAALRDALEFSRDPLMDRLSPSQRNTVQAGVIQAFEFSYELAWKFMKRWLEQNLGSAYVDGVSRRQLFRLAAESRLIDEVGNWFEYHEARNRTSHTYDPKRAAEVFAVIPAFFDDAQLLLQNLKARND